MRNKRNYNNLFASIMWTIVILLDLSLYFLMVYFGVFHAKSGTNIVLTFVAGTMVFGLPSIAVIVILIKECYEYWYLTDTTIFSKKLFRKRKIIQLNQIEKVEKKEVSNLFFGFWITETYHIYSANTKVTINITILMKNRKHYKDIDEVLSKYLIN